MGVGGQRVLHAGTKDRFWAIVPAAGAGRRMGEGAVPKQYLPLAGRTVIEWSLQPLLESDECEAVVVVLAREDPQWRALPVASHPRILTATGGAERMDSVLAGLDTIVARTAEDDWVLVHDAARPCLTSTDLQRLLAELRGDEVGGLLAAPLVDTLKRADSEQRVLETVPRAALWRALTPQMFRHGVLGRALRQARNAGVLVTDESQAIEALGLRPRLVAGDPDNVKVTLPEDLVRAERLLQARRD